ncbi:tumor protein p63-regulated gene 1-like protein isoform X1 [Arctopsyche grandis]|uniref:tumor protein p63-regulated gene 1-like protein isoform X1 n=1 Tax=Arctopsyche grandis TaxID=121162 RepID=UPI00406D68BA
MATASVGGVAPGSGTPGFGAGLHDSSDSAILTGVDVISPITSPVPTDSNTNRDRTVLPSHSVPYANEDPRDYFCHRNGLVESAFEECISTLIFPHEDGDVVGSWILTEISFWDTEKERIVILTTMAIIIVKYDFIAMKKKEFKRIPLGEVDTMVIGLLVYPPLSVVPRLNGIANGVSTVVRECIFNRLMQTSHSTIAGPIKKEDRLGPFDTKHFEARSRNMNGIRIMWNKGKPLNFLKRWNPFDKDIPFITYSCHPLFWHKGDQNESAKEMYNVDSFSEKLVNTVEQLNSNCKVHNASIVLQNYVGLTSLMHNKTSLGFFKVRGNFSY